MKSSIFPPIPMDTARAAHAVFGRSNFYLATGDHVNRLFDGLTLQVSNRWEHTPVRSLALMSLITVFQYLEGLPDHLVPGALQDRLDWKYALHLSLGYAHLEKLALCEFRQNIQLSQTGMQYFQVLLARLSAHTQASGQQLKDLRPEQVIGRVCMLSRLAKVWEALNQALEALAINQPEWLLDNSLPHWFERYDPLRKSLDLSADDQQQRSTAQAIGLDGQHLLQAIAKARMPVLNEPPEVIRLKNAWQEQYTQVGEQIWWRQATCAGCILAAQNGKNISQ